MKRALIVLSILFAALAAWIIAFPDKNPFTKLFSKKSTSASGSVTVSADVSDTSTNSTNYFPLKKGDVNYLVAEMQRGLNDFWGANLTVDGIFGSKTYSRLAALGFNADAVSSEEYIKIINGTA